MHEYRKDVAAQNADDADQAVQQQRHQPGGQHARSDQPLNRVDTQYLHRVDLLTNRSRPQVGAHGGGTRARHDQHRDQRADLGDRTERGTRTGQIRRTQFPQQDVERKADQHGKRDGHQHRRGQRDPSDKPRLFQEFAQLEGPPKDELDRVRRHRKQAPNRLHGPGEVPFQSQRGRPGDQRSSLAYLPSASDPSSMPRPAVFSAATTAVSSDEPRCRRSRPAAKCYADSHIPASIQA